MAPLFHLVMFTLLAMLPLLVHCGAGGGGTGMSAVPEDGVPAKETSWCVDCRYPYPYHNPR